MLLLRVDGDNFFWIAWLNWNRIYFIIGRCTPSSITEECFPLPSLFIWKSRHLKNLLYIMRELRRSKSKKNVWMNINLALHIERVWSDYYVKYVNQNKLKKYYNFMNILYYFGSNRSVNPRPPRLHKQIVLRLKEDLPWIWSTRPENFSS